MELKLSPRLERIAGYVTPGGVAVDVGTDHAYVPIFLLQRGVSPRAYATDVRPGPLENAAADAEKYGVADRLTLYLCDGLAACVPDSVDTVILAGMGGETMAGILERSPWALEKRLILQPQSKRRFLRRWLAVRGLAVLDAALAYDTGRIYLIWLAGPGVMNPEAVVDPPLLARRDPLLKPWLEERLKRGRKQLQGLRSARQRDAAAIAELEGELRELQEIYGKLEG